MRAKKDGGLEHGLFDSVRDQLSAAGIAQEEIDAHRQHIPATYWKHFKVEDITWHLQVIHDFLQGLATSHSTGTTPVVRWRANNSENRREIIVCTWDRQGLLAKVAGALATVGLNIEAARVFTRSDHIILDIFHVSGAGSNASIEDSRLNKMIILLEAALQPPPHIKFVTRLNGLDRSTSNGPSTAVIPHVSLDQRASDYTLIKVVSTDRLGMLHDLLCVLADAEVDVFEAWATTDDKAHCQLWVRGKDHRKITDASLLERLQLQLAETAI